MPGLEVAGHGHRGRRATSPALQPGERVMAALGMRRASPSRRCARQTRCFPIPDRMDFVTAAGFPIVYGTAHGALARRADLKPGETLLVLGAAGGVGARRGRDRQGDRRHGHRRGARRRQARGRRASTAPTISSTIASEDIRERVKATDRRTRRRRRLRSGRRRRVRRGPAHARLGRRASSSSASPAAAFRRSRPTSCWSRTSRRSGCSGASTATATRYSCSGWFAELARWYEAGKIKPHVSHAPAGRAGRRCDGHAAGAQIDRQGRPDVLDFAPNPTDCHARIPCKPASEPMTDPVHAQYEALPYPPRDPRDEAKRLDRRLAQPSCRSSTTSSSAAGSISPGRSARWSPAAAPATRRSCWRSSWRMRAARRLRSPISTGRTRRARSPRRAPARGLSNIRFVTGSLLDLDTLAPGQFDYIDCCGVLHHLESPKPALRHSCVRSHAAGGMGLMLYGALGRIGVYHVQGLLARLAAHDEAPAARLALARKLLAQLPATNWLKRNPVRQRPPGRRRCGPARPAAAHARPRLRGRRHRSTGRARRPEAARRSCRRRATSPRPI